uniref:Uncharacterized protein n=1 Tax=Salmo trutta TaxID=8032 RepID=A0A673ZMH9_SALTR
WRKLPLQKRGRSGDTRATFTIEETKSSLRRACTPSPCRGNGHPGTTMRSIPAPPGRCWQRP